MALLNIVVLSFLSVARAVIQKKSPGVGITPEAITPFATTYKDGYSMVTCAKDYMHLHGDKHGDGKYDYKLGPVANVSIIHYTEMIGRQEREEMTHEVCYGFCRTITGMVFFGITNGRDCYCMPFFKQMAGDSSDCDAPCDGDSTTMCGGKTKSSIFEMHMCNNTAQELASASAAANTSLGALYAAGSLVASVGNAMQAAADLLQPKFGKVGDSAATGNLQAAKVFAGEVIRASGDAARVQSALADLVTTAAGGALSTVEATEELTVNLIKGTEQADLKVKDMAAMEAKSLAPATNTSASLYYPVMYFVDRDYVDQPSTCGGEPAASPLVGNFVGCAAACENKVGKCVGFSYMAAAGPPGMDGLCFLFSKFATVTYYTGCGGNSTGFLQTARSVPGAVAETKCVAKLSEFEGTSIKPDASGKCESCLKEATKADRCFV